MNEEMRRITAENRIRATFEAIIRAEEARTWAGRVRLAKQFVKDHRWAFTSAAILGALVAVTR